MTVWGIPVAIAAPVAEPAAAGGAAAVAGYDTVGMAGGAIGAVAAAVDSRIESGSAPVVVGVAEVGGIDCVNCWR